MKENDLDNNEYFMPKITPDFLKNANEYPLFEKYLFRGAKRYITQKFIKGQIVISYLYDTTVKMETLCSRFYAVISGTSGDINMGS